MNDLWNFLDNHPEEKELIKAKHYKVIQLMEF